MSKVSEKIPVALARAGNYGPACQAAVRRAVDELGGINMFVKPGWNVLIKPNMVSAKEPERAITTHPEVVRALIRLVREAGAFPSVGDSPASVYKLEQVWERTGIRAVCKEEGVPLLSFEKTPSVMVETQDIAFSVAAPVLEADAVINAPKLKTHVLTILTNAVKNLYGTIPGFQKTYYHRKYPDVKRFSRLLSFLHDHIKPALTVCDAVVGMDGDGPSGGHPVELGFIAASSDAFALDAAICSLLRIKEKSVPFLKHRAVHFEWRGDKHDSLNLPRFRTPSTLPGMLIPRRLMDMLRPWVWIRPVISDKCRMCGLCVAACPVGALAQDAGVQPVFDYAKCIECCCCHEVCPHKAIDMTPSFLMRLASGRRLVPPKQ